MGKTIVRKHVDNTDAQVVWKEFLKTYEELFERGLRKEKLDSICTNTVLDDNFKHTTEQFVLYFNEQFRQLDEFQKHLNCSPTVKLILLQNAVRNISDLSIVETLDEF